MAKQLEFEFAETQAVFDPPPSEASYRQQTSRPVHVPPSNEVLSQALQEAATLLQVQGANRFRSEAYFRAANSLVALLKPAWHIYEAEGADGLMDIPGVTGAIAHGLENLIKGTRWTLLDRLNGDCEVEKTFASIPNIGAATAKRIVRELGIDSLADLQTAAWDGRLESLSGIGGRRLEAIRESLAGRGRSQIRSERRSPDRIPVAVILDVDDQYRFEARHRTLPLVKPSKNNPTDATWLPILHTDRGDRHFTVMYSNTIQAHQERAIRDWVIVLLEDHGQAAAQGQWTVITARFGRLKGRRIVRGREKECESYYRSRSR